MRDAKLREHKAAGETLARWEARLRERIGATSPAAPSSLNRIVGSTVVASLTDVPAGGRDGRMWRVRRGLAADGGAPEICDLEIGRLIDKHIGWLDVSMYDQILMREADRRTDFDE